MVDTSPLEIALSVSRHQLIEFLDTLWYCFPSRRYRWPLAEGRENGLADAAADPVVCD
jgi:hypothetical protein